MGWEDTQKMFAHFMENAVSKFGLRKMIEFRDVNLRKVYKGTYLSEGRLAGN